MTNLEITTLKRHKSIPSEATFSLPEFCVITGRNGSGKTHLLEALSSSETTSTVHCGSCLTEIQYVPLLGFNPSWTDGIEVGDLFQQLESVSQRVIEVIGNWKVDGQSCPILEFASRGGVTHILLKILEQIREKDPDFDNVSKSDVAECFFDIYPCFAEYKDSLFYARFADVVSAYHLRRVFNDINEFRAKKYPGSSISFLEESAFLEKYGPQPIDLVNRVLKRAHLPYEVIGPFEDNPFRKYTIRVVDRIRGIEISLDALSSGEKS